MRKHWLSAGGVAVALIVGVCYANLTPSSDSAADPLIVHEWGTFTTFSGSNGVHLDFRPLRDQDLPDFVLNRATQSGYVWLGKSRIRTRVRMETPVTYFYTKKERTVRASVEFPQGLLTEFYPPVVAMTPAFDSKLAIGGEGEPVGNSKLDWGEIDLIPESQLAPNLTNADTAAWMSKFVSAAVVPAAGENHYVHARNTDSALVHRRVQQRDVKPEVSDSLRGPTGHFAEKFLFYRGVGKFDVPVKVVAEQDGRLDVVNVGQHPLQRMLLIQVSGETRKYSLLPEVPPGQKFTTGNPNHSVSLKELREIVRGELAAAGLYEKEAQAMVDTWTDSWFTEEGTRLFYLVPQDVTDEILPLTITPAPDETLRVMVGRVEIMTASQEQRLLTAVRRSAKERAEKYEQLKASGQKIAIDQSVPPEIAELGRLAEPALCRLREISPDREVETEVELLLRRLNAEREAAEKAAEIAALWRC